MKLLAKKREKKPPILFLITIYDVNVLFKLRNGGSFFPDKNKIISFIVTGNLFD